MPWISFLASLTLRATNVRVAPKVVSSSQIETKNSLLEISSFDQLSKEPKANRTKPTTMTPQKQSPTYTGHSSPEGSKMT